MSIKLKRTDLMNSGMNETTACDPVSQSVRQLAGEVTDQLQRLSNNVDSMRRIMQQAGLIPTAVDSIEGASQPAPPRDSSLSAVIRDAMNDARVSNNRLEELTATLERELL